jgi:hypothetical protein
MEMSTMNDLVGKYRNGMGVEMEVTGPHLGPNILGAIYEAIIPDSLFGDRHMFVTPDGLKECGYVKLEGEKS